MSLLKTRVRSCKSKYADAITQKAYFQHFLSFFFQFSKEKNKKGSFFDYKINVNTASQRSILVKAKRRSGQKSKELLQEKFFEKNVDYNGPIFFSEAD